MSEANQSPPEEILDSGPTVQDYEPPTLTLGGREYPMRRLTVRDTFSLLRLAKNIAALGYQETIHRLASLVHLFARDAEMGPTLDEEGNVVLDQDGKPVMRVVKEKVEPAQVVVALAPLMGFPELGDPILDWLGSVLQMKPGEAQNLPMGCEADLLEGLAGHRELQAFFTNAPRLKASAVLAKLRALITAQSPELKADETGMIS